MFYVFISMSNMYFIHNEKKKIKNNNYNNNKNKKGIFKHLFFFIFIKRYIHATIQQNNM